MRAVRPQRAGFDAVRSSPGGYIGGRECAIIVRSTQGYANLPAAGTRPSQYLGIHVGRSGVAGLLLTQRLPQGEDAAGAHRDVVDRQVGARRRRLAGRPLARQNHRPARLVHRQRARTTGTIDRAGSRQRKRAPACALEFGRKPEASTEPPRREWRDPCRRARFRYRRAPDDDHAPAIQESCQAAHDPVSARFASVSWRLGVIVAPE
jgi:hypothetical protein